MSLRILVCGSRNALDATGVWRTLDDISPIPALIIAGGATGIDTFAQAWALRRGIPCMVFNAPWDSYLGRAAGPVRNGWMLEFGKPDLVLAFPGGKGTENMVAQARRRNIEVRHVRCEVG